MKRRQALVLLILLSLCGSAVCSYDEEYDDSEHYDEHHDDHYDGHHEEHYDDYHEEHHEDHLPAFGHEGDGPNMIQFETNSEQEHMKNFKKISNDVYQYEEEYGNCIKEISDHEYTEQRIEECVGRNFIKVVLDIKYVTLKIISRGDTKVRKLFIEGCYIPAGTVEEFSIACDLMERDALDLMWKGLDFVKLLMTNKEKYIREYGKIPYDNFRDMLDHLTDFSKEFFELMDEVDSHKEVTILRLKTLIDDRTKLIVEEAKNNPQIVLPPEVKHKIEITEELVDPNAISVENLPPAQILNSNPKDFGIAQRRARALNQTPRPNYRAPAISPAQRQQLYKTNHFRMFNNGQPYSGLNAAATPMRQKPVSQTRRAMNIQQPRINFGSLRNSERIGDVKFKSVHSSGSNRNWLSRRFK